MMWKSGLWNSNLSISQVLVLNQSPISTISPIARLSWNPKFVLSGDPLYFPKISRKWDGSLDMIIFVLQNANSWPGFSKIITLTVQCAMWDRSATYFEEIFHLDEKGLICDWHVCQLEFQNLDSLSLFFNLHSSYFRWLYSRHVLANWIINLA